MKTLAVKLLTCYFRHAIGFMIFCWFCSFPSKPLLPKKLELLQFFGKFLQVLFVRNTKENRAVSQGWNFVFVKSFIFKSLMILNFWSNLRVPKISVLSLFVRSMNEDYTAHRYGSLQFFTSKFELTSCNKNRSFLCRFLFFIYRDPRSLTCLNFTSSQRFQ